MPHPALLSGVAGMPGAMVACGVIWSLALGFAAGNYACSLVFRLPRGRSVLEHKPYCGECGAALATRDLFPVVSALMLKHRCRYCGATIPRSHFWTEILIGLLFVLCFLRFNFSQSYLLVAAVGVFLIVLAAIEHNDGVLIPKVMLTTAVCGMLYRTLVDGELYNFLGGALFGLIFGLLIWREGIRRVNHVYIPPPEAGVLAMAGICVGLRQLPLFILLFAAAYIALWVLKRRCVAAPAGIAVMAILLFIPPSLI